MVSIGKGSGSEATTSGNNKLREDLDQYLKSCFSESSAEALILHPG